MIKSTIDLHVHVHVLIHPHHALLTPSPLSICWNSTSDVTEQTAHCAFSLFIIIDNKYLSFYHAWPLHKRTYLNTHHTTTNARLTHQPIDLMYMCTLFTCTVHCTFWLAMWCWCVLMCFENPYFNVFFLWVANNYFIFQLSLAQNRLVHCSCTLHVAAHWLTTLNKCMSTHVHYMYMKYEE